MTTIEACVGFESKVFFSRFLNFLQGCWHNELFVTHEHASVWGISCSEEGPRLLYLQGFDQCLANSLSQQVTMVSVLSLFLIHPRQRLVVGHEMAPHV